LVARLRVLTGQALNERLVHRQIGHGAAVGLNVLDQQLGGYELPEARTAPILVNCLSLDTDRDLPLCQPPESLNIDECVERVEW
jgi:hypothetical protein